MTFEEWVRQGVQRGWISAPWCYVHGTPELTDEETAITEEEGDMDAICVTVVRLMP